MMPVPAPTVLWSSALEILISPALRRLTASSSSFAQPSKSIALTMPRLWSIVMSS